MLEFSTLNVQDPRQSSSVRPTTGSPGFQRALAVFLARPERRGETESTGLV